MLSWSCEWLWAQCLAIAAGLLLISYMDLPPDPDGLETVNGVVQRVGSEYRKSRGTFYRLDLTTPAGQSQTVRVRRGVTTEPAMQDLVGRTITAEVDGQAQAHSLETGGRVVLSLQTTRAIALSESRLMGFAALVAALLGIVLAAPTRVWRRVFAE